MICITKNNNNNNLNTRIFIYYASMHIVYV